MKHYYLLAAAAILASCADNGLVEENLSTEAKLSSTETPITFGSSTPALTRATSVGADAATKLNQHFVVYGTKHASTEDGTATNDELVFNQYNVEWTANTAGTTDSNSSNWEYVGKTAYSADVKDGQSIKYWDYSATAGYTFYAFSSSDISYPAASTDLVSVEKTTTGTDVYKKGYSVTVKEGANFDNLYYSDRKVVAKSDYDNTVVLTFRNMSSKVRVGFYETVPGYSVKINRFWFDTDATAPVTTYKAMADSTQTYFAAALQNVNKSAGSNTLTVTYYDATDPDVENRATVTNTTADYIFTLKLGTGIQAASKLGEASNLCTWDQEGGAYTTVYPFESNSNPMLICCDYTLTSTDGSKETIEVKNARAVVPVQYVQWKSNYAYTYLFKISDKSNGTTGHDPRDPEHPGDPDDPYDPTDPNTDPEGLFPITFDAYVESATDASSNYEQETITSVATNSVTTYQNGKVITGNNEYVAGSIYVVNMNTADKTIIVPTGIGAMSSKAQVYEVSGSNISEATVFANLTGAKNGISLTVVPSATRVQCVPAADGTNYDFGDKAAVKFNAESGKTYAYVYCTTQYVATEYNLAGDYDASTTYYWKTTDDVYFAASGITADNFETNKDDLYVVKTDGTPGVYDVKVIKVANK